MSDLTEFGNRFGSDTAAAPAPQRAGQATMVEQARAIAEVRAAVPQSPAMPLDAMQRLAESIAKSGLFGIRTADQALTLMSIAQAEGRHPALAARDYHIIQGTPAKKAEAMLRDFLSAGGRVEWHTLTDAEADATFSHPAGGSVRISWDAARVKRAELDKNPMHRKYPRQMLRSRAVAEGVRTVWPMATSGMYVPEEVDFPARSHEPIDITPSAEIMNPHTGEVFDVPPPMVAARSGGDAFRAYWKTLDPDGRTMLRPDLDAYQRIAEEADRERAREEFAGDRLGALERVATNSASAAVQERPGAEAAPLSPSSGRRGDGATGNGAQNTEHPHSEPRDAPADTNSPAGAHSEQEGTLSGGPPAREPTLAELVSAEIANARTEADVTALEVRHTRALNKLPHPEWLALKETIDRRKAELAGERAA